MTTQYFKIATGKFIEFNDVTQRAIIIVKDELVAHKQNLIARIGAVDPNMPTTNAEWIAYGKSHYPGVDHSVEQAELNHVLEQIAAIKDL